jgi:cation transporter-like permease
MSGLFEAIILIVLGVIAYMFSGELGRAGPFAKVLGIALFAVGILVLIFSLVSLA